MMQKVTLTPDRLLHGGRTMRVYIQAPDGQLHRFRGENIPGVAIVGGRTYHKNGKWSHYEYDVILAPGAAVIELYPELHQKSTFSRCTSWEDVIKRIGAPRPIVGLEAWFRAEYPKQAERLDAIAAALDEIEAVAEQAGAEIEAHVMEIHHGGFFRREQHLWGADIIVKAPDGRVGRLVCDDEKGRIVAPEAADWLKLVGFEYIPGHRGGFYIYRVACPAGSDYELDFDSVTDPAE